MKMQSFTRQKKKKKKKIRKMTQMYNQSFVIKLLDVFYFYKTVPKNLDSSY